jgi:threonine dehydrogenase-like Zn-dependent dehydrogenase
MAYAVEPNISDRDAALIEVFSIGFHACRRAELKKNDTVVIWGAGRIGQSILQAARTITENSIFIVDILDSRLQIAAHNFSRIIPINARQTDPLTVIRDYTKNRGVDVAFEAVGHAETLEERPHPVRGCILSIRGAGTVCVLGLADDPAPLIMKELIWREARIVASRVNHGEFSDAIYHLARGHLKPAALISSELPANEIQTAFQLLEQAPEKYLKFLIKVS